VSPILCTDRHWEREIDVFWNAWGQVFSLPEPSRLCGSHIHVSSSPEMEFDIFDLRHIAFGVIFYEPLIEQLLPHYRQNNKYCVINTQRSSMLNALAIANYGEPNLRVVWNELEEIDNPEDLRDFMQGGSKPKEDRYVLWNFDNILPGRSGTVEFRGGPGLRDPVRTKWWISVVVALVHLCLSQVCTPLPLQFSLRY
jgi:hypothetical protein